MASYLPAIEEVSEAIIERVRNVEPEQVDSTRVQLDRIIEDWLRLAELHPDLRYESRHGDRGGADDSGLT